MGAPSGMMDSQSIPDLGQAADLRMNNAKKSRSLGTEERLISFFIFIKKRIVTGRMAAGK